MKNQLLTLLMTQFFLVLVISLFFFVSKNISAGLSAFLGGTIAVVPAMLYAFKIINNKHSNLDKILTIHKRGMLIKYFSTFLLFGITYIYIKNYQIVPLITTYILILLSYLGSLILLRKVI